jgi:hypothetical protein
VTEPEDVWYDLRPFVVACAWLYATVRPIASPSPTPPYDLFTLYILRIAFDVLAFGGKLYDHAVDGAPLPGNWTIAVQVLNLTVLAISVVIILSMPLSIPSPEVNREEIVSEQIYS